MIHHSGNGIMDAVDSPCSFLFPFPVLTESSFDVRSHRISTCITQKNTQGESMLTLSSAPAIKTFTLSKESELRIEVSLDAPLRLQLTSGIAEIFDTELPPQYWVTFPPTHKFAFFTWNGATVEIDGTAKVAYVADETPMVSYVNVHAVLDCRRSRTKEKSMSGSSDSQGPRVIVVGPTDSGKSSLSMMLLSQVARLSWKPTFVDLDIGKGSISIPGTISATPIEMPWL